LILYGNNAGVDLEDPRDGSADGIIIIGDDIRDLDRCQEGPGGKALFVDDKFVLGNYIFGKYVGLKDRVENLLICLLENAG
jgi:hypothetical protein